MKRILIATLLVSMAAYADDKGAVPVTTIEKAELTDPKTWPSLDELWNETETGYEIKQALINGTPTAELLLGYEHSDLDDSPGGGKSANALLSRIRLNYKTDSYKGFNAFVQAQYVGPLNEHFSPKDAAYDTVSDPESFRFHQAYLAYTSQDSHARIGPQEIILDNARFIGNVGWRLNAQSFNAASIENHSISNLTLFYAYADSINEINGENNDNRQYHMINGESKIGEKNKASAFAYLQRNDNPGTERVDTYGLRLWGNCEMGYHEAMVAVQRDAFYAHVSAILDFEAIDAGGGVEYISGGSDSRDQFQTLNGTAHKFNGWADQFAGATGGGTSGGLIDAYLQASTVVCEDLKLMSVFHYFNTTDENAAGFEGAYGYELDASAKYPVCKNFDVLAKVAYYVKDGDSTANPTLDETVFWLRGTLKF